MIIKHFVCLAVLASLLVSSGGDQARADAGGTLLQVRCDDGRSRSAFAASDIVPDSTYKLYVRLGKAGQTAPVDVSAFDRTTGECRAVGSVLASNNAWQEIGTYSDTIANETIFQLFSSDLNDEIDANRPSLLLIDTAHTICVPNPECKVKIGTESGIIVPTSTSLSSNSLKLTRVIEPHQSDIVAVRYYVDDKLMYTLPALKPFDMRYVLHGGMKLSRVVEYASGQLVIFETYADENYISPLEDNLFRFLHTSSGVISVLTWLIGTTLIVTILRTILHVIHRKQQWRYDHGLAERPEAHMTAYEKQTFYTRQRIAGMVHLVMMWLLIGTSILAFIIAVNGYLIRVYKVDGHSMESTIQNGTWQVVNRIPKTIANINGLEYIPKRGEVIVVDAVYSLTDAVTSKEQAQTIIKRVIGLPGERVSVRDGVITVYNAEHPEGFEPDDKAKWADTMHRSTAKENIDLTLKSGELFVIGDNRPESIDSRYNGPVHARNVVGPVFIQPQ